ncbi:hypothetical protein FKM82_021054, partial [Ascaphus truei]
MEWIPVAGQGKGGNVVTFLVITKHVSTEPRCTQVQRLRRAALITGPKAAKAQEYQDSRLRRCCEDGMQENPMGYSCQRRVRYVLDAGECAAAFLECCKFVHEPEKVVRGHRRKIKQFSMC